MAVNVESQIIPLLFHSADEAASRSFHAPEVLTPDSYTLSLKHELVFKEGELKKVANGDVAYSPDHIVAIQKSLPDLYDQLGVADIEMFEREGVIYEFRQDLIAAGKPPWRRFTPASQV